MKRILYLILLVFFLFHSQGKSQINLKKNLSEKKHKLICTTYSPDGKYIATGGADNNVILWDAHSGSLVKRFEGLKGFPIALCFDNKSQCLAAGGKDRLVTVWNVSTGAEKFMLKGHKGDVLSIKFSPDDKYVVSAGIDSKIKVWDANSGAFVRDITGHSKQVNSIDFDQSGSTLVSGSADKSIKVWDFASGSVKKSFVAHSNWVRDVAFSPNQKYIASCGDDNIINVWDANTYELINTLRAHKNMVMDISFSPDGNYLISGSHDNKIVLFDLNKGSIIFQSPRQDNYVLSVDFDPLGKSFVSVTLYGEQLALWDASSLNISVDAINNAKVEATAPPPSSNPPSVQWTAPSQSNLTIANAIISVEANISSESDISKVEVYVNDKLYSTDSREDLADKTQGNTTRFKRNVFLKQGENKIKLVAINAGGSTNSEIKSVVYNLPQKPQISWVNPNSGSVATSSSEYTISSSIASQTNLDKVEIFINDQLVATDYNLTVSELSDYTLNYEKILALNEGNTTVKIAATNNSGTTYSDPVEINYSSQQRIIAPVDYKAPPNPYRFALIIGNEDYSSYQVGLESESDVEFAKSDAEAFHDYAIRYLGVPEDQAILKTNARYIEMRRELKKLSGVIEMTNGKAEIFFYYCGHGFPHENTKEPYIVPVDGSGTDLEFSAIKLKDVYAALTDFPSKRVTVFIDACFSGGGRNQGLVQARAVKVKPKEVQMQSNLVVFTASSEEQTAMSYKEKGHGLFTYYVLEKIKDTKGSVTYGELSDYITEQVGIKSYMVNSKKQVPQTNVSPSVLGEWENWKLR